jgi:hypothetical protein
LHSRAPFNAPTALPKQQARPAALSLRVGTRCLKESPVKRSTAAAAVTVQRSRRALVWIAAAVLGVGAVLVAPRAHAMQALDDEGLSQVTGQAAPVDLSQQKAPPVLNTVFNLLSAQGLKSSQLNAEQFRAVMAARGVNLSADLYNGSPVTQVQVDGAPVNASFELGHLLAGNFGVDYHGPSMGTVSFNNFDAHGTTLWVWFH